MQTMIVKKDLKVSAHLHGTIVELVPLVADVKDERSAKEEMLMPEARRHAAEIEKIGIVAVFFQRHLFGLFGVQKVFLRRASRWVGSHHERITVDVLLSAQYL